MSERIAVVTDSPADIPQELCEELGITIVPALIKWNDLTFDRDDPDSRRDFYERLPAMNPPPRTQAASSEQFKAVYQNLINGGVDQIVSIHVASSVSSFFTAASEAARAFGEKIKVIDSGQISLGLGFQVIEAARAVRDGSSLQDILRVVQETRKRVRLVAMLDSLDYLQEGGRVAALQAMLGAVLRNRLFLELHEGKVNFLEKVRTRFRAMNRLWDMVVTQGPYEQFAILHANAEEEALALLDRLRSSLPASPLIINVNSVLGTHVGPKAIGFAAVLRK